MTQDQFIRVSNKVSHIHVNNFTINSKFSKSNSIWQQATIWTAISPGTLAIAGMLAAVGHQQRSAARKFADQESFVTGGGGGDLRC
jgi:hypothetical protein